MTEKGQAFRMIVVALLLAAAWLGLGARLSYLHLGENKGLHARVQKMRQYEQPILVGRGRIFDRNGNLLALDLAVRHVNVNPQEINKSGHRTFIAQQLARVLELDPAIVTTRIDRPDRKQEYIKKFVKEDAVRQIIAMDLNRKGVFFDEVSQRNYPQGGLMCHVLGFSNLEGVGSAGIEQRLDRYLRGVPGLRVSEKDGKRREVYSRRVLEIQPQEGADVHLTLDQNLQFFTERALDHAMEQHRAKGAWAIVQEVKTGRILAMANRPSYDLNQFPDVQPDVRLNRATGYTYEPGSTFKVAIIAAALNEGLVTPSTVFDCENGIWYHAGKPLRDYHPHGRLSTADVLKKSSNIGAAKIALLLGQDRVYKYLRDFGIGQKTGIDLPGEEYGILNPLSKWSKLSISRIAMGHEVSVTALQMVNMLCGIANDGFLMRPTVVDHVVNKEGRTLLKPESMANGRPIRPETARLMVKLMTRATEKGGTGTKACIEGYTVAGKTGSAQKPMVGGYSDSAHYASFMGVFPAERPEIGIIVVVDEPQPYHTGGVVAAPVFKEIAEQAARYLDIEPVPENQAYRFDDQIPTVSL